MRIILGVGGGIAAYKSAELARLLMERGHAVRAVMTRAAEEFIRPLTFAALTGEKVLTDLFAIESAIEHIAVAQRHELLAIAPATADLMAKLAEQHVGLHSTRAGTWPTSKALRPDIGSYLQAQQPRP